jgi:ELWxxDGT repeat protein
MLVKDINPQPFSPSFLADLTAIGGTLFFTANDGVHGRELWKSDGTPDGTVLVKDINPGPGHSFPGGITDRTAVGGTFFFVASDGVHGHELWKSDGTTAGTVLVRDVDPGLSSSSPRELTAVGGTLFFTASDGVHGGELWKSDGTPDGTVLVKDIHPGPVGSGPIDLTAVGGTLFFRTLGDELWTSDGTPSGTVRVAEIPGCVFADDSQLTAVGGTLFFTADDGVHGQELWRTTGETPPGEDDPPPPPPGGLVLAATSPVPPGGTATWSWSNNGDTAFTLVATDGPGISGPIPLGTFGCCQTGFIVPATVPQGTYGTQLVGVPSGTISNRAALTVQFVPLTLTATTPLAPGTTATWTWDNPYGDTAFTLFVTSGPGIAGPLALATVPCCAATFVVPPNVPGGSYGTQLLAFPSLVISNPAPVTVHGVP